MSRRFEILGSATVSVNRSNPIQVRITGGQGKGLRGVTPPPGQNQHPSPQEKTHTPPLAWKAHPLFFVPGKIFS